ncbi:hypothetical protein ATI53_106913 [Salipiger aestuarii]|uniref:Uncharacterized protein n=1 Tax=Salipiger aestuarii TaxID=568098 RepID=A0A327XTW6_9RHOB|nr:hypothetical protein ATI53_106913 [Salipiger aestuarii]
MVDGLANGEKVSVVAEARIPVPGGDLAFCRNPLCPGSGALPDPFKGLKVSSPARADAVRDGLMRTRCLIPRFAGVIFSLARREARGRASSSRECHDHAHRRSCSTAIASVARAAEQGAWPQSRDDGDVAQARNCKRLEDGAEGAPLLRLATHRRAITTSDARALLSALRFDRRPRPSLDRKAPAMHIGWAEVVPIWGICRSAGASVATELIAGTVSPTRGHHHRLRHLLRRSFRQPGTRAPSAAGESPLTPATLRSGRGRRHCHAPDSGRRGCGGPVPCASGQPSDGFRWAGDTQLCDRTDLQWSGIKLARGSVSPFLWTVSSMANQTLEHPTSGAGGRRIPSSCLSNSRRKQARPCGQVLCRDSAQCIPPAWAV